MRRLFTVMTLAASAIAADARAAGPGVDLTIRDGRVWLASHDATPSEILAAWERVGRTTIVNGANAPGGRLTLELKGVPEQEALDAVLRSAAGFVARTRAEASVIPGSRFDRIVVLPISQPPPFVAAPPTPSPQVRPQNPSIAPGVQRIRGADGQPVADDQEGGPPRPAAASMPPGFSPPPQRPPQPQPAPPPQKAPVGVPVPGMVVPSPQQTPQPQRPPR